MGHIRKQIRASYEEKISQELLHKFILDKANAKLGDAFVNFVYSLAKSGVSKTPTGTKVSDFILSEAYKLSLWRKNELLLLKGKKGFLADQVEALILFFWIFELLDIDEMSISLMKLLNPEKLHHPREEEKVAIVSFQSLLDDCYTRFIKEISISDV
jgi:hypothetical protein